MKIQENSPRMTPFSSLMFGDVFRYKGMAVIKIHAFKSESGITLKAINLGDGRHFSLAFDDEKTLVEPLDATLVIN